MSVSEYVKKVNINLNSLAPGRPRCHFKTAIFNLVLLIANDNALRCMPRDLTDDKSTLVKVMTWCRQATSHYLSQCWPSSMSPYGVTRPQWVLNNIHCGYYCPVQMHLIPQGPLSLTQINYEYAVDNITPMYDYVMQSHIHAPTSFVV